MRNAALVLLGICFGVGATLGFRYLYPSIAEPRRGAVCTIQVRSDKFLRNPRMGGQPTHAVYGAYQAMDGEWIVIAPFSGDKSMLWIPRREVLGINWQAENSVLQNE